jgi:hypothetical protein
MRRLTRTPTRCGFTIVELLVAAALTLFVMYLLTAVFTSALGSFSAVKAIGDMQGKLRSATATIRRDLIEDHFDRGFSAKAGGPKLSDQKMVRFNAQTNLWEPNQSWEPPAEGFFRIFQGGVGTFEGLNDEGLSSVRATDHLLHFTVKRYIRKREDMFATAITDLGPPNTSVYLRTQPLDFITPGQFLSQWVEVAYFLVPSGASANGGLPLYYLVRREKLLMPTLTMPGLANNKIIPSGNYGNLSQSNTNAVGAAQFVSSADVTAPCLRMNMDNYTGLATSNGGIQATAGSAVTGYRPLFTGNDIVLTDVLSFQVLVAHDLAPATSAAEFPFDNIPQVPLTVTLLGANPSYNAGWAGQRIFDTWSSSSAQGVFDYSTWNRDPATTLPPLPGTNIPFRTRITAIQIRLRVWDNKTQQARQMTFVQDM